jgi:hypothetical protein
MHLYKTKKHPIKLVKNSAWAIKVIEDPQINKNNHKKFAQEQTNISIIRDRLSSELKALLLVFLITKL